jgi:hypothetical protein
MTDEEWGPWIEHSGVEPCKEPVGVYIQLELDLEPDTWPSDWRKLQPRLIEGTLRYPASRSWIKTPGFSTVVRYRVRKPKGLMMLEELIQSLPAPTKTKETV